MKNNSDKSREIAEHLVAIMTNEEAKYEKEFNEWIEENPSAYDVLNRLSNEQDLTADCKNFRLKDKKKSAEKMLSKIAKKRNRRIITRISSFAAALVVISFGIFYFTNDKPQLRQNLKSEALKGEESVKLILDNGEIVELNKIEDTVETAHFSFRKNGVKEISFIDTPKKEATTEDLSMNTLIVPKKKNYSIRLSDGTKVMLNAESELTFPAKFKGDTREVTIKGEGYFEVAKDSKVPFIVHTMGTAIKVYGTKFNVNSYNSPIIETLLIEGSVGVTVKEKEQMLNPNQLITINDNSGQTRIEDVRNVQKYVGWISDYFVFEADNLSKVIGELSRWYDVEFTIDNGSKLNVPISGSFKRDTELGEILNALELISGIKLKIAE